MRRSLDGADDVQRFEGLFVELLAYGNLFFRQVGQRQELFSQVPQLFDFLGWFFTLFTVVSQPVVPGMAGGSCPPVGAQVGQVVADVFYVGYVEGPGRYLNCIPVAEFIVEADVDDFKVCFYAYGIPVIGN